MLWVGLFASFTYLVLSAWAQIVFGDRYLWMSDVRLVSIAGGTLLYAHALRAAMRSRTGAGGPARLALHVVGASLIMLALRSEEHTSELQSLMRISYAVFCSKTKLLDHTLRLSASVTSS